MDIREFSLAGILLSIISFVGYTAFGYQEVTMSNVINLSNLNVLQSAIELQKLETNYQSIESHIGGMDIDNTIIDPKYLKIIPRDYITGQSFKYGTSITQPHLYQIAITLSKTPNSIDIDNYKTEKTSVAAIKQNFSFEDYGRRIYISENNKPFTNYQGSLHNIGFLSVKEKEFKYFQNFNNNASYNIDSVVINGTSNIPY